MFHTHKLPFQLKWESSFHEIMYSIIRFHKQYRVFNIRDAIKPLFFYKGRRNNPNYVLLHNRLIIQHNRTTNEFEVQFYCTALHYIMLYWITILLTKPVWTSHLIRILFKTNPHNYHFIWAGIVSDNTAARKPTPPS